MTTILIDGVEYTPKNSDSPIKIAILQRGWVMVGRFERDGSACTLRDASVIRVRGTTNGIGEIALHGPTEKTVLDKCGTIQFDYLTVVALIDCEEALWKRAL